MHKLRKIARKRKILFVRAATILFPLAISLLLLSQTAFAKNTYVITDGSRVFTYTTFATDPPTVLGEAGLQLDEGDSSPTQPGVVTSTITIQRGQDITITYYGETIHATSYGETVEELLTRLNISLAKNDVVSQPLDASTYDGMELRIEEVLHLEQTYTSAVPHETTYCYDSSIPEGFESVLVQGSDGELLCTATVTYVNGQETNRTVSSQKMTVSPVTEVIARGSGETAQVDPGAMPVIGDGTITLPTGEVLRFSRTMQVGATAYYCEPWERGITATGTRARVGAIAVDPAVIPYGTRMFIISNDGEYIYGIATAEDCGYLIENTRVDLYFNTREECVQFGFRECTAYILGSE